MTSDAFQSQQGRVLLSPLERAPICGHAPYRWSAVVVMALVCFAAIAVMYWPVFRSIFSGGSLYSDVLLPTGASFTQLVQSATTPWVFGSGTGIPAPPTPWLLVLMLASLVTPGHVTAALAMILFVAAPLSALSFWALARLTRSDVVRVLGGLLWASTGIMFGWYACRPICRCLPYRCVPAGCVCIRVPCRACTIPKTRSSRAHPVQAAAIAALRFIPAVVAAEPQLLFALIVVFLMFLLFVRRKRACCC